MATNHHYEELMKQIMIVKDRVRGVVHGHNSGLYLHGRPGTSKTFTVRSTLETLGAGYVFSNGHLTPIGLYDLIAENRDRVIVLDDLSQIFNEPIALQLLLAALGNPHDGSNVRTVKYKTAKGAKEVPFAGGVIGISNLPLDGHHHEVLAALRDRAYVINYEPSDEHIIALIHKLSEKDVNGVPPKKAQTVATFLIAECKARGIHPSVRLYVDKAIPDFKLCEAGQSETHWKDLIVSNLEQQLIELKHPTNDLSRAEQTEAERRVVLDILKTATTKAERLQAWHGRTGKSQPTFYRHFKELKKLGRWPLNEDTDAGT